MMATKSKEENSVTAAPPKVESKPLHAVEDLERRLASLGTTPVASDAEDQVAIAKPPTPVAPAVALPSVKGGKSALLARIMAAQEKAKQAGAAAGKVAEEPPKVQAAPAGPPPSFDVFAQTQGKPSQPPQPPPAFDAALLPPMSAPPPSFASVENQVMDQVAPSGPVASAPDFDLLDVEHSALQAVPPPIAAPPAPSPEEEMIMGLEGLSPEERKALIDEQRKIMQQIEEEKTANEAAIASATADAFDQRSNTYVAHMAGGGTTTRAPLSSGASSAAGPTVGSSGRTVNLGGGEEVALHGPERTEAAIRDGTAQLVQCVNCESWMQVTGNASLMYCPVCTTVSPVIKSDASPQQASQMDEDAKLAQRLQAEEYTRGSTGTQSRSQRQVARSNVSAPTPQSESMWDTITGIFSVDPMATKATPSVQDTRGVTRPPGGGGLEPARTGQDIQTIEFSNDEGQGLLGSGGDGGRAPARVAQSNSNIFACVADGAASAIASVGTALNTQNLAKDSDGNVHGVDSSSLLSMPNVSRNPGASYSSLPSDG